MRLETIHVCPIQHTDIADDDARLFKTLGIRQDDGESYGVKTRPLAAAMDAKGKERCLNERSRKLAQESSVNDVIAYGIANQPYDRMTVDSPHDIGTMLFRGFGTNFQGGGNLFIAVLFRQELYNLPLAIGEQRYRAGTEPAGFLGSPRQRFI
jgi:hypothetical protein